MIREANLHWQYQDTDTNLIMPWYTLPALEWLKKQDTSQWTVFESGAGYSTIWWRLNCKSLLTVESNYKWACAMGELSDRGFGIWCRENLEEFGHFIEWWNRSHNMGGGEVGKFPSFQSSPCHKFDCIVIDGDERVNSLAFSIQYVKSGGYLIFDNYGQTDFPSAEIIDALLEGWEKQIFRQPNHSDWCTAIFKKNGNNT